MNKQRATVLGVISGIAVIGGIIMCVLLQQTVLTIARSHTIKDSLSNEHWGEGLDRVSEGVALSGLVYIIPGVVGIIAALVQHKCLYVTTSVFTIISVLIMGLICFLFGLTLIALIFGVGSISEYCKDSVSGCMCRSVEEGTYQTMPFNTCAQLKRFTSLAIALALFVILTWVAVLIEFITSVYFCCKTATSRPGGVIIASPQPLLPPGEMAPPSYGMDYPLPAKV